MNGQAVLSLISPERVPATPNTTSLCSASLPLAAVRNLDLQQRAEPQFAAACATSIAACITSICSVLYELAPVCKTLSLCSRTLTALTDALQKVVAHCAVHRKSCTFTGGNCSDKGRGMLKHLQSNTRRLRMNASWLDGRGTTGNAKRQRQDTLLAVGVAVGSWFASQWNRCGDFCRKVLDCARTDKLLCTGL